MRCFTRPFGMASPFMPEFFAARGLEPQWLGIVLAGGTAVRLVSGGVAGPIGDRLRALRLVLIVCLAAAALATLGYLPAGRFWPLFALNLIQAAVLGPVTLLADALALDAAARPRPPSPGFEYGVVRGAGSAAFVAGTLLSGQAVGGFGLNAIIWGEAMLLGAAVFFARLVPEAGEPQGEPGGICASAACRHCGRLCAAAAPGLSPPDGGRHAGAGQPRDA